MTPYEILWLKGSLSPMLSLARLKGVGTSGHNFPSKNVAKPTNSVTEWESKYLLKSWRGVTFLKYGFWKEDIQKSEESAEPNFPDYASVDASDGSGIYSSDEYGSSSGPWEVTAIS